ncbi:phage virion morphogenesis protein [Marinobacter sp.]|uniref:phage virion morphogenesis protein n=1 Tax=Marinobacter sp. TaxID=50741 RepID=UPI0034A1DA9B
MAGINVEVDDAELRKALSKLENMDQHFDGLYAQMGAYLVRKTKDRFRAEESPDGTPWAPLSQETTLSEGNPFSKRKNRDKVLTESGDLMGLLRFQVDGNTLEVGSNQPYAAMMHFGGKTSPRSMIPNATVPARPFLGVSDDDSAHILKLVERYVGNLLKSP